MKRKVSFQLADIFFEKASIASSYEKTKDKSACLEKSPLRKPPLSSQWEYKRGCVTECSPGDIPPEKASADGSVLHPPDVVQGEVEPAYARIKGLLSNNVHKYFKQK